MKTRRQFLVLAAALPATLAGARLALAATPPVFATDGVAINGYDPVAYFTEGRPVEGTDAFTSEWDGATVRFASAENKAMFDADRERFAPRYGGYCAYAVSKGYTATTDPNAWSIYEDRLYLNYSRIVRGLWSRDIPGHIARADANWPGVLSA